MVPTLDSVERRCLSHNHQPAGRPGVCVDHHHVFAQPGERLTVQACYLEGVAMKMDTVIVRAPQTTSGRWTNCDLKQ